MIYKRIISVGDTERIDEVEGELNEITSLLNILDKTQVFPDNDPILRHIEFCEEREDIAEREV